MGLPREQMTGLFCTWMQVGNIYLWQHIEQLDFVVIEDAVLD